MKTSSPIYTIHAQECRVLGHKRVTRAALTISLVSDSCALSYESHEGICTCSITRVECFFLILYHSEDNIIMYTFVYIMISSEWFVSYRKETIREA